MNQSLLEKIARQLIKVETGESLGMFNGKAGIIIFLLCYSKFSNVEKYRSEASALLDETFNMIDLCDDFGYQNGLAGIASAVEFITTHHFLIENFDSVLIDLDYLLLSYLEAKGFNIDRGLRLKEEIWIGTYLINRAINTANVSTRERLLEGISSIINTMKVSYNSIPDVLLVIYFLQATYSLNLREEKGAIYLNYAIDKLETMMLEDEHFNLFPGSFNPYIVSYVYLTAAIKTKTPSFKARADFVEARFGGKYDKYLSGHQVSLSNSLHNLLLFQELNRINPSPSYEYQINRWSERVNTLADELDKSYDYSHKVYGLGLKDGIAGVGLKLLSVSKSIKNDWLRLVPLFVYDGQ